MTRLRVWTAEYGGPCGLCDRRIEEGDAAVYVDDEPCHAECARDDGHVLTDDGRES